MQLRLLLLLLLSSCFCIIYLFISVSLFRNPNSNLSSVLPPPSSSKASSDRTSLRHIVFGIASNAKSWPKRKELISLWWNPLSQIRGCIFLDSIPSGGSRASFPPMCISGNTSRFRYTYRKGLRSAVRVARMVSETVALYQHSNDVRWFVFGDDDTVFFPGNLVKTLSKYDHELWYYIGANSEIYQQNDFFSFEMAFGGAGFAISDRLARVLVKAFDSCLDRYPHLYGSDNRIYSCAAELGVGLTHEPGFHQMDFQGDVSGYLAAHALTPLVSLHHLDYLDPIFPNKTPIAALDHLFNAVKFDSQRILQKTVCYDRWFSWTVSISWGYVVQVYQGHILLPDVIPVQQTFRQWRKGSVLAGAYNFNSKPLHPDPCRRPTTFFLHNVSSFRRDAIETTYKRSEIGNCTIDMDSPKKIEEVRVFSKKLDLDIKQLQAPRRQCCDVLRSSVDKVMKIGIRKCKEEELIQMPS